MRISEWNTYAIYGYTHDVAQDPRSQGGVHIHEVRRARSGSHLPEQRQPPVLWCL